MEAIFNALGPARAFSPLQILFSLLLSFFMSLLLAAVYRHTHSGFSYSRSFVQTISLAAIVACIMIIAIGNNLARGLGILGALALIRFRTPIRDPRDIIHLFASLFMQFRIVSIQRHVAIAVIDDYELTEVPKPIREHDASDGDGCDFRTCFRLDEHP